MVWPGLAELRNDARADGPSAFTQGESAAEVDSDGFARRDDDPRGLAGQAKVRVDQVDLRVDVRGTQVQLRLVAGDEGRVSYRLTGIQRRWRFLKIVFDVKNEHAVSSTT